MSTLLQNKENIKYDTMVTLVTIQCYKCCVPFAIPERLNQVLKDTKETFYCPNGHGQIYTKSTESILREQLAKAEQDRLKSEQDLKNQLAASRQSTNFWNERFSKQVTETKKVKTRLKNTRLRIAHGVCPCCNRTFEDLARHMKSKHPEFIDTSKK